VLDAARPPEDIAEAVAQRVAGLLDEGDAARPASRSNPAPPGLDLAAPDLSPGAPPAGAPHLAAPHAAGEHATDAVAPLEGMAELVGINDDEGPDGPPAVADNAPEVGRRRRS
jgi:hypothetical protein